MPRTVVKQPNGRYAYWSTISDCFVVLNADRDQMMKLIADTPGICESDAETLSYDMDRLDMGFPRFPRFNQESGGFDALTWALAIGRIIAVHGQAKAEMILSIYRAYHLTAEWVFL